MATLAMVLFPIPTVPGAGDPAWIWNNPVTSGGGMDGGNGNGSPPLPVMVGDDGLIGASLLERFFYGMENNKSIFFDSEERAVISQYPDILTFRLSQYAEQYGGKPDGSTAFILSEADQQLYPRFTELLRNISTFVEQHERVKQALSRHTNLPWSKIKPLLKFGAGPKIIIRNLKPEFGEKAYGHTVHPGFPESRIEIQDSFVRGLEVSTGTREATAFLLVVTLLHELTHYGAVDGGRNESRIDEFGDDFEREILGTTIIRDNAGRLLVQFNKLN
ncbi:hypothetical protein [Spirosoma montaniterrae]|uniref:Tox-MPTase3 domain-containing protein n=1 Tax=Spirosoma montaniterrae TaxID=1178516 RepID=A0A1P9WZ42_9BACT|nr:hypothetical protein [Spirosoma montaniterrae]AQG80647.1 hypothetical protein AWR27_15735 [Spirosoma montaniterrae]